MNSDHSDKSSRRQVLLGTGAAAMAAVWPYRGLAGSMGGTQAATANPTLAPSILEYLGDLDQAVAQIANTWRPDDPQYHADLYRQIMMNLSYSYFVYFHADAEHPDWAPLWNPVYTCQPIPTTSIFIVQSAAI